MKKKLLTKTTIILLAIIAVVVFLVYRQKKKNATVTEKRGTELSKPYTAAEIEKLNLDENYITWDVDGIRFYKRNGASSVDWRIIDSSLGSEDDVIDKLPNDVISHYQSNRADGATGLIQSAISSGAPALIGAILWTVEKNPILRRRVAPELYH